MAGHPPLQTSNLEQVLQAFTLKFLRLEKIME
jgi:hypothetical protein